MEKIELHHVLTTDLDSEIKKEVFNKIEDFISFVNEFEEKKDIVYLICINSANFWGQNKPFDKNKVTPDRVEIIISENIKTAKLILSLMMQKLEQPENTQVFIQAYESYYDAYKVAYDMREDNVLCNLDN